MSSITIIVITTSKSSSVPKSNKNCAKIEAEELERYKRHKAICKKRQGTMSN